MDSSLACRLVKLDLMLAPLESAQSLHQTFASCPNLLTAMQVRNIIGDDGVEAIARHCTQLRRIRIENLEDHYGFVSQKGLISLATSCVNLQFVAIYTSDINNAALAAFGSCCPRIYDFRIAVLDSPTPLSELPLKREGLSDRGLAQVGSLAGNINWLLLGCAGNSDTGFLSLARGCQNLRKLELRHCPFSEGAIAAGVRRMRCLRYVWSQGYRQVDPTDLLRMGPAWNVEYVPSTDVVTTQFVAYRSLSGPRLDCPTDIIFQK